MNKSEVRFSQHTHRCTLINRGCCLAEWIKNINGTAWRAFSPPLDARLYHTDSPRLADTVGSCSMLPREKQGVVDSELKVLAFFSQNFRGLHASLCPPGIRHDQCSCCRLVHYSYAHCSTHSRCVSTYPEPTTYSRSSLLRRSRRICDRGERYAWFFGWVSVSANIP